MSKREEIRKRKQRQQRRQLLTIAGVIAVIAIGAAGWLIYQNYQSTLPVPEGSFTTVPTQTWHAVGCPECNQSGYRGRIGIFEVWRLRGEDADLILKHADEHTMRRHIRRCGTVSLVEDELRKVAEGTTSLAEIQTRGAFGFSSSRETNNPSAEQSPPGQITKQAA